jgi:hypothetical protein
MSFTGLAVSFSLFGWEPRYCIGAVENARLAREHYPGAAVLVYYRTDVPESCITDLLGLGVKLVGSDCSAIDPYCWRFLTHDLPGYTHWVSRDCDSRIGRREAAAVAAWMASGAKAHMMYDAPVHRKRHMLAGMFGLRSRTFSMAQLLAAHGPERLKFHGDQEFLKKHVYPLIAHSVVAHSDGPLRYIPSRFRHPFPIEVPDEQHVGFNHEVP